MISTLFGCFDATEPAGGLVGAGAGLGLGLGWGWGWAGLGLVAWDQAERPMCDVRTFQRHGGSSPAGRS